MKNKVILVLLIFSFFFLRLYRIEERMNFSMDQGMFLLRSWEIFKNKEITLLGPTASPIVHQHQFFQGPLIYYSLILIMLISKWNPLVASGVMVFLNFLAAIVIYLATKKIFNKKIGLITLIIYSFLIPSINFSNFLWNPNFLLILTPVFIFLGAKAFKNKKIWFLWFGLMGGICLQFHFQFLLILGFNLLFLILKKRNWKEVLLFIGGAILGYSPLLLFDLRNNFYNIKTMWQWITVGGDNNFSFQIYYFLSFIPFLAIGLGYILDKIKISFVYLLLIILIGSDFWLVLNQKGAFGMTSGWSYKTEVEVVKKILKNGCPDKFNVVSTLNGDTRSYDLRFLLTRDGCKPMGVDKYPEAKTLFLTAPPNRRPENETVWEISSLGKFEIKREETLSETIKFYELERL